MSKGSKPRPILDRKEYERRWEQTFKPKESDK